MAIDSRSKRFSMMLLECQGFGLPPVDGSFLANDRVDLLALYSGFADAGGGGSLIGGTLRPCMRGGLLSLSGGML